ncbi:uncharacterized protein LOC113521424 [Galleria mellonella]|uniref:Uncharacterized protein LOC113521424 n=1 Tax=Galleria mellonella TaxID=7137 RepID=A0ABM3MU71_GALME|nr:uncharacterized protein LOC113521424 [Galleria mellonella]
MFSLILSKLTIPNITKTSRIRHVKKCHSIFGIKDLLNQEKFENFTIVPVASEHHEPAMDIIKRHYLKEHVLVRARNMDLSNDRALDEYLTNLFKQGNTLLAKTEDDKIAGICVGFASSPVDPQNLRNYAFYRQDPNTKDFLYFTAKLQETPNLWEIFKQQKIYEIRMLAVAPEYRRQGLAVLLIEKSKEQAHDQSYKVLRMDCINPYDYKIAERCMLQCLVKFPLHKLRGANAPYIKRSSKHNKCVRVYVQVRLADTPDRTTMKQRAIELENLIE